MKLGAPCKHMEDVFHLPVFMCVFTWYSHPLTHAVGRTRVPHVLGWGRVVWARRGVWGGACVPADTYTNTLGSVKRDGRSFPHGLLCLKTVPSRVVVRYWAQDTNSPEKGVLQVQEIAGLWSCLIHLGNNTDVVALSVGGRSDMYWLTYLRDQESQRSPWVTSWDYVHFNVVIPQRALHE